MNAPQHSDPARPVEPEGWGRKGRRHGLRVLSAVIGTLLVASIVLLLGLWAVLSYAPVPLPERVTAQVEAELNRLMTANTVSLEAMTVSFVSGTVAPQVIFREITMTDPAGLPRARIPEVRVELDAAKLLSREVSPVRVDVIDAAMTLRRGASGQIDLRLSEAESTANVSLQDTFARLDTMFASPAFGGLEAVNGERLSLTMLDTETGKVLEVQDATMRLERRPNVLRLDVGGALAGSRDTEIALTIERDASEGRTGIGLRFGNLDAGDVATLAPALGWLDLVDAPISGNLEAGLSDDGRLGAMQGAMRIASGALALDGAADPVPFERISLDMRYDPDIRRVFFEAVDLAARDLSFQATGHADVAQSGQSFIGQIELQDVVADPEGVFLEPLRFETVMADLRLSLAPHPQLEIGQAVFLRPGMEMTARGRVAARPEGLETALDIGIDRLSTDALQALYPQTMTPSFRAWMRYSLFTGDVTGMELIWRQAPGAAPVSHVGFDFDGVQVRAFRYMPHVTDASGHLTLTDGRVDIRLEEGFMQAPNHSPVSLAGSTIFIPDNRTARPQSVFDARIRGTLQDTLALLEFHPVNLFRDSDMTIARLGNGEIEARVQSSATLGRFPPRHNRPVDYAVEAVLSDYSADALVPNRALASDRLILQVRPHEISASGVASLDGVPVTGQWTRPLGPGTDGSSQIEARFPLTQEALAALDVPLPAWFLSGAGAADVRIDLVPEEPPRLTVASDLDGVRLTIPPLGWSLRASQTGAVTATITMEEQPVVTDLRLQGAGMAFRGRFTPSATAGFGRLVADQLRIGNWLDVRGIMRSRGAGRAPAVEIAGGAIDVRGVPQGRSGGSAGAGGGDPVPFSAQLQTLRLSEGIALTDVTAELVSGGGVSGRFVANVNGTAPIIGTLAPGPEGQTLRVQASDGGAVLRAANVFRSAYGGPMELSLQATGQPGQFQGALTLDQPRLRNAPVMAELLNAISVVGLLEQMMSGEGINLGIVNARFLLTPSQVILQEGAAVGPSMGVSLDGVFDLEAGQLNMQGVLSPLYIVNGLIGALFAPRQEGLFGFSYRLTGAASDPQVSVNPLSILTPGVFREIFRQPPPELTTDP